MGNLQNNVQRATIIAPGNKTINNCILQAQNIKDTITKAKLHQASGHEASKYYSGELTTS